MGRWEEDIEALAQQHNISVLAICRYADDYLILFEGNDTALDSWITCLNQKDANIKVTLELESSGSLSYLDIEINRKTDGFTTKVHRKACNTLQIPAFHSFTEQRYLTAGIRSDAIRAFRYCSTASDRKAEISFVRRKFAAYNYPSSLIDSTINRALSDMRRERLASPQPQETPSQSPIRLSIPYSGKSFYQLKRAAASIGIHLVSKPQHTLRSLICSTAKHHLPMKQKSQVVYMIKCSCTDGNNRRLYVGETDRELGTRVREHQDAWRRNNSSTVSAFQLHKNCSPDFDNPKILATEPRRLHRLLLESAFIQSANNSNTIITSPNDTRLNHNSSYKLPERWLHLIRDICKLD